MLDRLVDFLIQNETFVRHKSTYHVVFIVKSTSFHLILRRSILGKQAFDVDFSVDTL